MIDPPQVGRLCKKHLSDEIASDSDDEKKVWAAEKRALEKQKNQQNNDRRNKESTGAASPTSHPSTSAIGEKQPAIRPDKYKVS